MSQELQEQQNNPLHGLKLEQLLTELVDYYGWDILDAAMRINCFHTKPTIESSLKYLRKTEWAREKLENFYLSRFKRMPKASEEQFKLPPRQRTYPSGIEPRDPMPLTVESILSSQAKAASSHKARASSGGRYNRRS
ncbi:VF530 family DNA-binding protein [Vibrio genomosp. F10]|nr:VF530 family DNA-binding protein [Vibrio genomosp. F10]OEF10599.1 hypothetical protein A1QI_00420 [Vibrio genomosp. F10 str. 9ZB36]